MKKFLTYVAGIIVIALIGAVALVPQSVYAQNQQQICEGSGGTWTKDAAAPTGGSCSSADNRTVLGTIQTITDVLLFILGAVAIIMIIVGGLRYTLSQGDQAAMTGAKNTILYAIIGLIVAVMAYAIVHFVLGAFNIK